MSDEITTKEEILLAVSISMGALFFATLITLLIARYSKKIHEFCLKHLPCFREEPQKDDTNDSFLKHVDKIPLMLSKKDENDFVIPGKIYYEKIQPSMMKGPATPEESNRGLRGENQENADTEEKIFTEPTRSPRRGVLGMLRSKSIDVVPSFSRSREFRESLENGYDDSAGRHFLHNVQQQSQQQQRRKERRLRGSYQMTDINPFALRRNALSNSEGQLMNFSQASADFRSKIHSISSDASVESEDHEDGPLPVDGASSTKSSSIDYSDEEADRLGSLLELRPELYDTSRKRSVGIGGLGKIKISLQYIDQDKTKLEVVLHGMTQLLLRPHATGLYTKVTLLPEREIEHKSKIHQAIMNPVFEQSFVFEKSQPIESFNTKTIRFNIFTLYGQDRSNVYGESNIPLARSEIFGQVRTENVLNIKPPSNANEVGDVLLEILYTKSDAFHVIVRTLRLAPTTSVDYMNALQVKLSIKKRRNKVGQTVTALCPLRRSDSYIPVNSETKQTIPRENFMQYSLNITVNGKQKLLGKTTRIGRTVLGDGIFGEAGNLHWTAIFSSPGLQYNSWHVIYSS